MMFAMYASKHFIFFFSGVRFFDLIPRHPVSPLSDRRNVVKLYERAVEFRKLACRWDQIESVQWVTADRSLNLQIKSRRSQTAKIPGSVSEIDA